MTTEAALPGTWEWTLYNTRRRESRTYVQTELALDGEARLVQIGVKIGAVLAEGGYTWADLWDLTDENRDVDWNEVAKLVAHVVQYAPELMAEAATVFLSVYPTDEDGTPIPEYPDQVRFIRGALNTSKFIDLCRVFMQQNDYARMLAPFSRTLSGTMDAFAGDAQGSPSSTSEEPSSAPQVMASDGSTITLEPTPEPTKIREEPEKGSATYSEPSPT